MELFNEYFPIITALIRNYSNRIFLWHTLISKPRIYTTPIYITISDKNFPREESLHYAKRKWEPQMAAIVSNSRSVAYHTDRGVGNWISPLSEVMEYGVFCWEILGQSALLLLVPYSASAPRSFLSIPALRRFLQLTLDWPNDPQIDQMTYNHEYSMARVIFSAILYRIVMLQQGIGLLMKLNISRCTAIAPS